MWQHQCLRCLFVFVLTCFSAKSTVVNVKDFGVVGDGQTDDTVAVRKAASACLSTNGCTMLFPSPLQVLTATFNISSNTELTVETGASILGIFNPNEYSLLPAVPSYPVDTSKNSNPRYGGLVLAMNAENVKINGGGTIDGQGQQWWSAYRDHQLQFARPRLIEMHNVKNLEIENVNIQNSPFWTVWVYSCNQVIIRNVTITNPVDAPNTDGIDIDSSSNVIVESSYISTIDDHISIKSGAQKEGYEYNTPSENITILNNEFGTGSGLAIGSETTGGIHNILIANNSIYDPSANLVRIKGCAYYGGVLSNITYSNNFARVVDTAIFVDVFYECHPPQNQTTPFTKYQDINLTRLSTDLAVEAGSITCASQSPCEINLSDIDLWHLRGFVACKNVFGKVSNVSPTPCYSS